MNGFIRKLSLFSLIGALFVGGCQQETTSGTDKNGEKASQGNVKIGFVVKQYEEPWFQMEMKFAQKCADEHGFELIKLGAVDGEKVLTVLDNFAAQGVKGFVICAPDVRLGPSIKRRADQYGMKFIAVDDRFVDADGKFMENVHYLGLAARDIGAQAAQAMDAEMQRRGWKMEDTAVCVSTFDELDTARERTQGAMEKLAELGVPRERMFKAPNKATTVEGSYDAASALLPQHPGVKNWLVVGMNDSAVMGAVRAIRKNGFSSDNVIGVGINGTDCIGEFEQSEPTGFYGSMLLSPDIHGYQTTEMLYLWITEGKEPPLLTPVAKATLITRENYRQVYAEKGMTLPE